MLYSVKSGRRNAFGIIYCALSLFFVITFTPQSTLLFAQTPDELIAQGNSFHDHFDTYNAYKAFKLAYESDTTNYDAMWKMASELIDMGNELPKSADQNQKYSEALDIAAKAVQLNPNNAKGHIIMALALEKTALDKSGTDRIKVLNQARGAAEKAIEINPDEDLGYGLLGRWHVAMANTGWITRTYSNLFVVSTPAASYDTAIEQFKKAIALRPVGISHYLELGKTYAILEKWTQAGEEFEKILTLPVADKSDSKSQREAKHYLQLLQQNKFSELTDIIEE